jgi:hypothetical protein
MNHPVTCTCLLATLLLIGCSGSDTTSTVAPPAGSRQAPAATPAGDELNQAIQQPLDRARAVEGDLIKDREALDEELQEQGG